MNQKDHHYGKEDKARLDGSYDFSAGVDTWCCEGCHQKKARAEHEEREHEAQLNGYKHDSESAVESIGTTVIARAAVSIVLP